jgi:hypothetical protein
MKSTFFRGHSDINATTLLYDSPWEMPQILRLQISPMVWDYVPIITRK